MAHAGGRPSKYSKKFCKLLIKYFSEAPTQIQVLKKEIIKSNGTIEREYTTLAGNFPTFSDFTFINKLGVHRLTEWYNAKIRNDKWRYPEFREAYNRAKALQKNFITHNAMRGLTPPATFIFVAKNITDMRDKTDVDVTSGGKELKGVIGFNYLPPEKQEKLNAGDNASTQANN